MIAPCYHAIMMTRDQKRSLKIDGPKGQWKSNKLVTKEELRKGALANPEMPGIDYARPTTRADCERGIRPCPFVSCRYNLYLEVSSRGSIKLNFPHLEPHEMIHSCALDLADNGKLTYEEVGAALNVVRERARNIEHDALVAIIRSPLGAALAEHAEGGLPIKRYRLPIWQPYQETKDTK